MMDGRAATEHRGAEAHPGPLFAIAGLAARDSSHAQPAIRRHLRALGVVCSFGAGRPAGSVIVSRM